MNSAVTSSQGGSDPLQGGPDSTGTGSKVMCEPDFLELYKKVSDSPFYTTYSEPKKSLISAKEKIIQIDSFKEKYKGLECYEWQYASKPIAVNTDENLEYARNNANEAIKEIYDNYPDLKQLSDKDLGLGIVTICEEDFLREYRSLPNSSFHVYIFNIEEFNKIKENVEKIEGFMSDHKGWACRENEFTSAIVVNTDEKLKMSLSYFKSAINDALERDSSILYKANLKECEKEFKKRYSSLIKKHVDYLSKEELKSYVDKIEKFNETYAGVKCRIRNIISDIVVIVDSNSNLLAKRKEAEKKLKIKSNSCENEMLRQYYELLELETYREGKKYYTDWVDKMKKFMSSYGTASECWDANSGKKIKVKSDSLIKANMKMAKLKIHQIERSESISACKDSYKDKYNSIVETYNNFFEEKIFVEDGEEIKKFYVKVSITEGQYKNLRNRIITFKNNNKGICKWGENVSQLSTDSSMNTILKACNKKLLHGDMNTKYFKAKSKFEEKTGWRIPESSVWNVILGRLFTVTREGEHKVSDLIGWSNAFYEVIIEISVTLIEHNLSSDAIESVGIRLRMLIDELDKLDKSSYISNNDIGKNPNSGNKTDLSKRKKSKEEELRGKLIVMLRTYWGGDREKLERLIKNNFSKALKIINLYIHPDKLQFEAEKTKFTEIFVEFDKLRKSWKEITKN